MSPLAKFRHIAHDHEPDLDLLVDVFRARCEARALLVSHALMHLHDAVDGLQAAAVAQGLVTGYGQDHIQQIMDEAFGRRASW